MYFLKYLFTGTIKNGLSNDEHGVGKYYKIIDGKPIFVSTYTGSYKDGKRHGKGISENTIENINILQKNLSDNQKLFEGNFVDDYPSGTGKLTMTSGAYLIGEFGGNDAKNAKGKWYDKNGKFTANLNQSSSPIIK